MHAIGLSWRSLNRVNDLNYSFDFVPGSVGSGLMTHSPGFSGGEILRFSKNCVCLLTKMLEAQFQMGGDPTEKGDFRSGNRRNKIYGSINSNVRCSFVNILF